MKSEHTFSRAGSLRIDWLPRDRYFVCWRPHSSAGCNTPKEVLAFARWPASTPTGQALREWLQGINLRADEPAAVAAAPDGGGFGPPAAADENDPTANTRTVI